MAVFRLFTLTSSVFVLEDWHPLWKRTAVVANGSFVKSEIVFDFFFFVFFLHIYILIVRYFCRTESFVDFGFSFSGHTILYESKFYIERVCRLSVRQYFFWGSARKGGFVVAFYFLINCF